MRVLIVDDNEFAAKAISWALSEEGFVTAVVHLGRQVPGTIGRFRPDVLVLDISLPDLNGMHVARLVRQDWPDLPIIFASGGHDRFGPDLQKSTAFLIKPYATATLVDAILRLTYGSSSSDL